MEGVYTVTVDGPEPFTWSGYADNVSDALYQAITAREEEIST